MDSLQELFKENPEEAISAFAFNTGRLIEHIIETTTKNLFEKNKDLEAKILNFREKLLKDMPFLSDSTGDLIIQEYDRIFDITSDAEEGATFTLD